MKVKLLIPRATAAGPQRIGDVIDVDPEEGKRLIDRGKAQPVTPSGEPVEPPKPIETAMLEGGKPRSRKSRRKRNEPVE